MGATVVPGFEFDDFRLITRQDLVDRFPQHQTLIEDLTMIWTFQKKWQTLFCTFSSKKYCK